MRSYILCASWLMIPFVVSLVVSRIKIYRKALSFIGAFVLGIAYPLIIITIDYHLMPQSRSRCANPEMLFLLGYWVIGVPVLLVIQAIVNDFTMGGKKV